MNYLKIEKKLKTNLKDLFTEKAEDNIFCESFCINNMQHFLSLGATLNFKLRRIFLSVHLTVKNKRPTYKVTGDSISQTFYNHQKLYNFVLSETVKFLSQNGYNLKNSLHFIKWDDV